MIIWYDKFGKIKRVLTHGVPARKSTTEFEIYAYFDGISASTLGSNATLRLRNPNEEEVTPYTSLDKNNYEFSLMDDETAESVSPFVAGNSYPMYKFSNLSLNMLGLWHGTIEITISGTTQLNGLVSIPVDDAVGPVDSTITHDQYYELINLLGEKLPKSAGSLQSLTGDLYMASETGIHIGGIEAISHVTNVFGDNRLVLGSVATPSFQSISVRATDKIHLQALTDVHNKRITNVGTPTESSDAINKGYLETEIAKHITTSDSNQKIKNGLIVTDDNNYIYISPARNSEQTDTISSGLNDLTISTFKHNGNVNILSTGNVNIGSGNGNIELATNTGSVRVNESPVLTKATLNLENGISGDSSIQQKLSGSNTWTINYSNDLTPPSVSEGTGEGGSGGGSSSIDTSTTISVPESKTGTFGATGRGSAVLGAKAQATGNRAIATGSGSIAEGGNSFTSGAENYAHGGSSLATGYQTRAMGDEAISTGVRTQANGQASFAGGYNTEANAYYSIAYGSHNKVNSNAPASTVLGAGNVASYPYKLVVGVYNSDSSNLFEVGNGSSDDNRSNALYVSRDGTTYAKAFSFLSGNLRLSPAESRYYFGTGNNFVGDVGQYYGVMASGKPLKLENYGNGIEIKATPGIKLVTSNVSLDVDDIATKQNVATAKTELTNLINSKVSSVYKFMGSVPTYADLPTNVTETGQVYNVEQGGMNYSSVYNSSTGTLIWDSLGGLSVDLSPYIKKDGSVAMTGNLNLDGNDIDDADSIGASQINTDGLATDEITSRTGDGISILDSLTSDLEPKTDETYNLGSSSSKWNKIYSKEFAMGKNIDNAVGMETVMWSGYPSIQLRMPLLTNQNIIQHGSRLFMTDYDLMNNTTKKLKSATTEATDDDNVVVTKGYLSAQLTASAESVSASSNIVETTYADLKALRDAGTLSAGTWYRITDYVATSTQSYTGVANGTIAGEEYIYFDIIVLATSSNSLSETNCKLCSHSGTTYLEEYDFNKFFVNYSIDNDKKRFEWADTTNGKGVIWYMKDDYGNETYYDHLNITMNMLMDGTGWSYDSKYKTFNHNSSKRCKVFNNKIYPVFGGMDSFTKKIPYQLPKIVLHAPNSSSMATYIISNNTFVGCNNISFGAKSNYWSKGMNGCTFKNCNNITFKTPSGSSFGIEVYYCVFKNTSMSRFTENLTYCTFEDCNYFTSSRKSYTLSKCSFYRCSSICTNVSKSTSITKFNFSNCKYLYVDNNDGNYTDVNISYVSGSNSNTWKTLTVTEGYVNYIGNAHKDVYVE